MAWVFNPFTFSLEFTVKNSWRGVLAAEPSDPQQGWRYINSSTGNQYIYYGTQWQVLSDQQ